MPPVDASALERVVETLPQLYPGPGGAVAVVKDGMPIVRHAWGFANLETRQPYTPATLAPICSISKQFTCATMIDAVADPAALDSLVAAQLPRLEGQRPSARELADNQSGLRDYWAVSVLCGAMPEGEFQPADSARLIGLTKSLHFQPGTRYSYSNGNFRILALALEEHTGRDFGDLVMNRIVRPGGLETAVFGPDTAALPGGATGYEGTLATGWRPGLNRIYWKGDAGLCASLDDMIAWERFIDRTRDDEAGLYRRLSRPPTFRGGQPASYGLGLVHKTRWGHAMTGHGGAIRGWRLQRFWMPSERLSVAIAFNHESDSHRAALHVLDAALGRSTGLAPSDAAMAAPYVGRWLDEEIGLLLDIAPNPDGSIAAAYDGGTETLSVGPDGVAVGADTTLLRETGGLRIVRPADAIRSLARPVEDGPAEDIAGLYRSDDLESELEVVNAGGGWFGGFRGILGQGPMMAMTPAGAGVWRIACHRSLDAPSPGDWTVRLGGVHAERSLHVGCWLARDVVFQQKR